MLVVPTASCSSPCPPQIRPEPQGPAQPSLGNLPDQLDITRSSLGAEYMPPAVELQHIRPRRADRRLERPQRGAQLQVDDPHEQGHDHGPRRGPEQALDAGLRRGGAAPRVRQVQRARPEQVLHGEEGAPVQLHDARPVVDGREGDDGGQQRGRDGALRGGRVARRVQGVQQGRAEEEHGHLVEELRVPVEAGVEDGREDADEEERDLHHVHAEEDLFLPIST